MNMTEAEWLACTDPKLMLDFLRGPESFVIKEVFGRQVPFQEFPHRQIGGRKLRLFSCACCRRLWDLLDEDHCRKVVEESESLGCSGNLPDLPLDSCRKAVELAERAADEEVSREELCNASEAADAFHVPPQEYAACYVEGIEPFDTELMATGHAAYAACYAAQEDADAAWGVVREAAYAVGYLRSTGFGGVVEGGDPEERAAQCSLLREIVGNPHRQPRIDPAWLAWNDGTVVKLAEGMYDERVFDRMPVLADALEEAGCHDPDILDHCRQPGEHVRGCWIVDLILGME